MTTNYNIWSPRKNPSWISLFSITMTLLQHGAGTDADYFGCCRIPGQILTNLAVAETAADTDYFGFSCQRVPISSVSTWRAPISCISTQQKPTPESRDQMPNADIMLQLRIQAWSRILRKCVTDCCSNGVRLIVRPVHISLRPHILQWFSPPLETQRHQQSRT